MHPPIRNHAVQIVLILLSCLLPIISAHSIARNPLGYLSLIEDPIIHTPSHRVHALSSFDLSFRLHRGRQRIKLTLEPNHDIIPDGAKVEYLDSDGKVASEEPLDRMGFKVFKGYAWLEQADGSWQTVGWARVVVRRDGVSPLFEGAFTVMHNNHHIQMRTNYMSTKHPLDPIVEEHKDEIMVLWRDSDIKTETFHTELKRSEDGVPVEDEQSCHFEKLAFNKDPNHPVYQTVLKRDVGFWGSMSLDSLLGKRQIEGTQGGTGGNSAGVNLAATIGNSAGCPTARRVALVGVATDCTYTGTFNGTEATRQNIITQFNTASDLYEKTFNITLGLHTLTVNEGACPGTPPSSAPWNEPCTANATIQDRLSSFSAWRGARANDTNAYWTLLTNCPTGSAVGLAWLGQLCVMDSQTSTDETGAQETVNGANIVAKTQTEWQVIAHESGHTFGAVHDCDTQTCNDGTTVAAQQCCPLSTTTCDAGGKYIMNPSTGAGITQFSPCTVGNICSALGRNSVKSTCLTSNKGVTTITGQQCGNGIVEEGEDCDCGGADNCANDQCCDAATCKFKNNAVCDDANEDCCRGCQFAAANTVCRPSTGVCDPQETCSGNNATCPADVTTPDGQSCGNGLTCASGQCTSRDLQCKTLMGSLTSTNDTYACDDQTCSLSCAAPEFGPNKCFGMMQNFLDGTTCGGGGKCENGVCKGSSVAKEVQSWINRNKPVVIGIACAMGVLVLLIGFVCVRRILDSVRRKKRLQEKRSLQAYGQYNAPYPPAFVPYPPKRAYTQAARYG